MPSWTKNDILSALLDVTKVLALEVLQNTTKFSKVHLSSSLKETK